MRRLAWTMALATVLALLAMPSMAMTIVEITTPGGIKAWLVKDKTAPVVSMSFSFAGGSAAEPKGREGVTQMAASLAGEGAGPYDSTAFKTELDAISASMGLQSGVDRVGGSLRTLRDNRHRAFELLALMLQQPRFDATAIERVRTRVLASIARGKEVPRRVASQTLQELVFAGHPYGRPGEGTEESVKAIGAADLRDRLKDVLARDRLKIAVVGDIDEAELAPLLDMAFATLPAKGAPDDVPAWNGPLKARTVVVEKSVPQSTVVMAQPGIRRQDPDWYAATLVNYALGGGSFNSRLMEEVREKRGLAYGVSSSLSPYAHGGLITASVATENARVAESVALIKEQWRLIASGGLSDFELANAKSYVIQSFALNMQSSGQIAELLHDLQVDGLGRDYLDRRRAIFEAITMADIKRVAARLFRADELVVVVVGQPKDLVTTPQ